MDLLQQIVNQGIALHKNGRFQEAANLYNRVLNRDPFNEQLLFLLSDAYLRMEFNGLGVNLLSGVVGRNPQNSNAWCNLGVGFRKENDYQSALGCWHKALEVAGDSAEVCNNIAGVYADRAEPKEALRWLERGLRLRPDDVEGNWLKALALLSMRNWEAGWKQYDWRRKLPNWDSRPKVIAPEWDGSYVERLYIHGEQGVGDEVMFACALPFVKAKHVTVEVHRKVAPLIQKSFPDFDVVTEAIPCEYDAKISMGSLIGMFGMNPEPYLNPDPWRVEFYREELKKLGPGPYLAITWFGGTKQTRVEDRSIGLDALKPILDAYTCVSAQYSDENPLVEEQRKQAGLVKINEESAGMDLHEQAALMKAVDAVVTVQQTAVHVAGAVGAKTYALIGKRPHWRYGVEGDSLPFYKSVKLYRQTDFWPVDRLKADLDADFGKVPRAEQAAS